MRISIEKQNRVNINKLKPAMTNEDSGECTATDGVPMTTNQMREYLQGYFGSPVVLRKQGTTSITCPHCLKKHDHGLEPTPAVTKFTVCCKGLTISPHQSLCAFLAWPRGN